MQFQLPGLVTTAEEAATRPELAVLSAMAHGNGPEGVQVALTLEAALEGVEALLLLVGHTSLQALKPAEVLAMTTARVAIDCVGGWEAQDWRAAGFQFYRLGDRKNI